MSENILDKIVAYKKIEVVKRKAMNFNEHNKLDYLAQIKPSDISFLQAIQGKTRVHLIAEIKTASPSQGVIVNNFNLLETIHCYNSYASAISVLTDSHFFGGSFHNLQITRANSYLPLLCKDFIIDEYQIYEARSFGANAILLIVAILDLSQLSYFYEIAKSLNLDVLFEVHNQAELDKIKSLQPLIIGVNNRSLQDFSIDHNLTLKLSEFINKNTVLVAESGLDNIKDIQAITNVADAALIGTAIMKSVSPINKIKELTQLPAVKICGITNINDAIEAVKNGATYLGLIFATSPRKITLNLAKEIITATKQNYPFIKIGGVFLNNTNTWQIANELNLDFVQLHGEENLEFIHTGKRIFKGNIWKTVSISNNEKDNWHQLDLINNVLPYLEVVLFDTFIKGKKGGTGQTFNWDFLLREEVQKMKDKIKIGVAGGLKSENIHLAKSYGDILDVSSGVEKMPGLKDKSLLKSLFINLKSL